VSSVPAVRYPRRAARTNRPDATFHDQGWHVTEGVIAVHLLDGLTAFGHPNSIRIA
jgi:hypothetical protein